MNNRDQLLLELRGGAIGTVSETTSPEESFQNKVLRPVLKAQNNLFVAAMRNHIAKHKGDFYALTPEKKLQFIDNAIQKDVKFRNALKGMIIGLFTEEDYAEYIRNSSNLNKRMMNMLTERLHSQIQLFENA